jgi:GTP1/Obg family GTP-binding protein
VFSSFRDNADGRQTRINNIQRFGQEMLDEMYGMMAYEKCLSAFHLLQASSVHSSNISERIKINNSSR